MEIVRQTFEKLLEAKTLEDVDTILDSLHIEKKYRMDSSTYPPLTFSISKEEINELTSPPAKAGGFIGGHALKRSVPPR